MKYCKLWIFLDTQTSSVEIERVCDRADECIMETAAVSVAPVNGGPEQMVIFVVLKKGFNIEPEKLKSLFSRTIQSNLNPLFKVWLFGYSISFTYNQYYHHHLIILKRSDSCFKFKGVIFELLHPIVLTENQMSNAPITTKFIT